MVVKIAAKSGFCFGVKKAVQMAEKYTEEHSELHVLGQIIHNDQESTRLEERGLIKIDNFDDVENKPVMIRAHGIGKHVYDEGEKKHLDFIDCTCPFVRKVHKIVDEHHNKGYKIIIVGNVSHPEIVGINGWCNHKALVISNADELEVLEDGKYCVVAQTTLRYDVWDAVVTKLVDMKLSDLQIHNTICSATSERQKAAMALAPTVDLMIVIGGYHSSNTRKLYEVCSKLCPETIHVEKKSELVMTNFNKYGIIGITAGASTPDWVIQEIYDYLVAL